MLSSLFFHRLKFLANQIRASCKSRLIIINDGMKQPLKCSKFVQLFARSINSLWALVTPILAISVWEETDGSEDWSTLGKYGDIFNMESDNEYREILRNLGTSIQIQTDFYKNEQEFSQLCSSCCLDLQHPACWTRMNWIEEFMAV